MSDCSFKLSHYNETLFAYVANGYGLLDFSDYFKLLNDNNLPEKFIVLRHDIDISLNAAGGFARIEHSHSARSTFFIRLHSPFYNPLTLANLKMFIHMHELYGSTFGLHLELDLAELIPSIKTALWLESGINLLRSMLPGIIPVISFHFTDQRIADDAPWIHSHEFRVVHHKMPRLKYLSDSRARWREGCFCQWINKVPRLHVLTHPIWWFETSPQENY